MFSFVLQMDEASALRQIQCINDLEKRCAIQKMDNYGIDYSVNILSKYKKDWCQLRLSVTAHVEAGAFLWTVTISISTSVESQVRIAHLLQNIWA